MKKLFKGFIILALVCLSTLVSYGQNSVFAGYSSVQSANVGDTIPMSLFYVNLADPASGYIHNVSVAHVEINHPGGGTDNTGNLITNGALVTLISVDDSSFPWIITTNGVFPVANSEIVLSNHGDGVIVVAHYTVRPEDVGNLVTYGTIESQWGGGTAGNNTTVSPAVPVVEKRFYVGYETKRLAAGQHGIGYSYVMHAPNVSTVLTNLSVSDAQLYKYNTLNGVYLISTLARGISDGWDNDFNFSAGDGAFLDVYTNAVITLHGKVPVGKVSNNIQVSPDYNLALISSKLPVEGKLVTDLGFSVRSGDLFYKPRFNGARTEYDVFIYDQVIGGWWPSEPVLPLNSSIWIRRLTDQNIVWEQTLFNETNDNRYHDIDATRPFDPEINAYPITVRCEKKAGETLIFEYSSANLSVWHEFARFPATATPSELVSAEWISRDGISRGIIRITARQ